MNSSKAAQSPYKIKLLKTLFDKTFKAMVQIWVLKYQVPIYSLFQLMLITTGRHNLSESGDTLIVVVFKVELNYNLLSVIPSKGYRF